MIGIIELPNLLTPDECKIAIEHIESKMAEQSSMSDDKVLADYYRGILLPRLPIFFKTKDNFLKIENLSDKITFGKQREAIDKHTDRQQGENNLLKLSIYLNETSNKAGTHFWNKYFQSKSGQGIIFDIRLEHFGEPFKKGEIKFVIGFRVLTQIITPYK